MSEFGISRPQVPLWEWERPPAADTAWAGLAGVAAPLIGGFCLAAVIGLLTTATPPPQVEAAVFFLCAAAVCLLLCVERTFSAARFAADPEQLLAWAPGARRDLGRLLELARHQRTYDLQSKRRRGHAVHFYNGGVLFFLLGILGVIFPDSFGAASVWRLLAIVAVVAAAVFELFITVETVFPKLAGWIGPAQPVRPGPPCPLSDDVAVVADEEMRESMLREVEHAQGCSWADLAEVEFRDDVPASFLGVDLGSPVWTGEGQHVAALFRRNETLVAVWDGVVFGCADHVLERATRWWGGADAPPEVAELIEQLGGRADEGLRGRNAG